MESMFAEVGVSSLDVSHLDTQNVNYMYNMFARCGNLESLDLSSFDTSKVTSMGYMFEGCTSLKSLNLTGFDTSNVSSFRSMFSDCKSLSVLDISSFDTSNIRDIYCMFVGCETVKTIYVSDKWNIEDVRDYSSMFRDCYELVGGNGTVYDENNVDKTYACIDTSEHKGYLTAKV
jgi:surface protein